MRLSVRNASLLYLQAFALWLFVAPWQTRFVMARTLWQGGIWEYGTVGVYATEILLWIAIALYMAHRWQDARHAMHVRSAAYKVKKYRGALGIIAALAAYYVARAAYPLAAAQALLHIGEAAVAGYIIFQISADAARAQMLRRWFLAGVCVQAAIALAQFMTQESVSARVFGLVAHNAWMGGSSVIENAGGRWLRAYGAFAHPNILGGYMAIGIIFLAYELLHAKTERTLRDIVRVIGILLCIALAAGGLIVSFSRSAWAACAVGLCIMSWHAARTDAQYALKRLGRAWCVIVAVACISVWSAPDLFFTRTHLADRLEIKSVQERAASYRDAWLVFRTAPVWGVGPGNFTAVLHAHDGARNVWDYQPVHNAFLLMLIELGIAPAVLLGWYMMRRIRVRNIPPYLWSIIAALAALALCDHYLWSLLSGLMLAAAALTLNMSDSAL